MNDRLLTGKNLRMLYRRKSEVVVVYLVMLALAIVGAFTSDVFSPQRTFATFCLQTSACSLSHLHSSSSSRWAAWICQPARSFRSSTLWLLR